MTFGEFVKQVREEKGILQSEMAKKIGVGQQYFTHLESYGIEPKFMRACQILNVLELNAQEVYDLLRFDYQPSVSEETHGKKGGDGAD
jgi:predicted transcriptional regulator